MPRGHRRHEAEFEERVARMIRNNAKLRRLTKQILRQQERLRKELSDRGWRIYLRLDELVMERQAELIESLGRDHGS